MGLEELKLATFSMATPGEMQLCLRSLRDESYLARVQEATSLEERGQRGQTVCLRVDD